MTNRRGRRRPDPGEHPANLSEDDLERRLAGGAGLGGPVASRAPAPIDPGMQIGGPDSGGPGGPRGRGRAVGRGRGDDGGRRRGLIWRDAGLVLVLLVLLAVGARIVIPSEPTTAIASPSAASSEVAAVASPSPTATPTATPAATEIATPTDVIASVEPSANPTASASASPTAVPAPTPTLAPGQTPRPSPRPTPKPTPTPIATATLTVYLQVINDDGGTEAAGDWTVVISGANASPASFPGSTGGRLVTVLAGQVYSVGTLGPSGYGRTVAGDCTGPLASGAHGLCTITKDDLAAGVKVKTVVTNGAFAGDPSHFLVAVDATPSPLSDAGSATGTTFTFWGNHTYSADIDPGTLGSYTVAKSGNCSGTAVNGFIASCTLTLTDPSASSIDPAGWALVVLIPRAWPPSAARRFRPMGKGRG